MSPEELRFIGRSRKESPLLFKVAKQLEEQSDVIKRLRAEIYLIRNALSKACGDDSDVVKACIDSQRDDPDRDDFRYEDPQAIFGDPRA